MKFSHASLDRLLTGNLKLGKTLLTAFTTPLCYGENLKSD